MKNEKLTVVRALEIIKKAEEQNLITWVDAVMFRRKIKGAVNNATYAYASGINQRCQKLLELEIKIK